MERIRDLDDPRMDGILRRVLDFDHRPNAAAAIAGFRQHVAACGLSIEALARRCGRELRGALVTMRVPGGSAMLVPARCGSDGITPGDQGLALDAALEQLAVEQVSFVQVLLPEEAPADAGLLLARRFQRLTNLLYLDRGVVYPWCETVQPERVQWLAYLPERHDLFRQLVESTYRQSLDCPELSQLRTAEQALAAHRAAGPFDAQLWMIALWRAQPAGCLFLAPVVSASAMEVVYVGVAPDYRGRGLGRELMRRALEVSRRAGRERLTLVVDERNAPARALYASLHFTPIARRTAYLWRPPPSQSVVQSG